MIRRFRGCMLFGLLGFVPALGCAGGPAGSTSNSLLPPLTAPELSARKEKAELPPDQAAQACLATAKEMEKNGHDLQAIYQYEMARNYDSRLNAKVCRNLARLYDRIGDSQRALAEYKQCLLQNPKDPDLLNDIGYCHYQKGEWLEAEKWFRQALDVAPQHQRAAINLGMTLGQKGGKHYEEALEMFKRVNTPGEAHVNMGFIYQTHAKWDEAKKAYRTALELQPDLDLARRALAKLEDEPMPRKSASDTAVASDRPTPNKPEPERTTATRIYPPEDRAVIQARALQGPPDLKQAVREQQERDAKIAELQEFRKRQLETAQIAQPPPVDPPLLADPAEENQAATQEGSPRSPRSPRSQKPLKTLPMTKPIVVGVPEENAHRAPSEGAPVAVSFE
jgi:tetratricopeptide (TPR) repeat protein